MKKHNFVWKIGQTPLCKCLLLNFAYMGGMLLFFTPFLSIDDYVMSQYAYGVFSEDYDYCVRYENFIYGRLLTFLMKILPMVPWYTVLFYLWIFIALTILSYIILEYFNGYLGIAVANIILLFFAYEGYVCIQFTKVAGIIGAVGIFVLMLTKASWKLKTCGIFLMFMACLIRYEVFKMVLGAWLCAFFLKWLYDFVVFKKIKPGKKQLAGIIIGTVLFCLIPYLPQYSSEEEKEFWDLYWEYNAVRVSVQDYGYPPYEENKEAYEDAGISENDLYVWYSWNADADALTPETGKKIQAIRAGTYEAAEGEGNAEITEKREGIFDKYNWKSVVSFLKEFPKAFLNIDVCFCLLLVEILIFLCCKIKRQDFWGAVLVPNAVLFALNYYLFVSGRYLQHRVDVGIFMVVCSIFLFVVAESEGIEVRHVERPVAVGIGMFLLLNVPYQYYPDDRETVREDVIATNRLFYEQTEKDSGSCYYFAANRGEGSTPMRVFYNTFEVPKVGSGKNCFYSNTIYDKKRMRLYGIDKIFVDMADSDSIYFVMSETDTNQPAWEEYLSEYCGTEVKLVLVKDYLGKKIYRAFSKPITDCLAVKDLEETDGIVSEISFSVSENNKFEMEGTAYLQGKSGFSQNSYIQVLDSQTKRCEIFVTCQTCDMKKTYGDEGYFAQINASIELPAFYDEEDVINLIIEDAGTFYSVNLQGESA